MADAPIYARTNGYLKRRLVDIGSRVKTGQLLAEIDAPELEMQLQQARSDLATAEANLRLAQLTADRYRELVKTDSVTQQDADNVAGTLEARKTAADSARHNVRRLEQLRAFTQITSPFDGVVTVRNTDVGALIDPGASGGAARELFHIASTERLRVSLNIPERFSRVARPGLTADLTLGEFPGRRFTATLVRSSEAIDVASRTCSWSSRWTTRAGSCFQARSCEVHIRLPKAASTLVLPVNALIFRGEGVRVAVVSGNGTIAMMPVTLGRDFGTEIEVLAGLRRTPASSSVRPTRSWTGSRCGSSRRPTASREKDRRSERDAPGRARSRDPRVCLRDGSEGTSAPGRRRRRLSRRRAAGSRRSPATRWRAARGGRCCRTRG